MRILQLHTRYREPGGEDAVVDAEARVLRQAGHHVATHRAVNPTDGRETAAALARSSWNRTAAAQVRALAVRERPDVAHVHNTWYALSPSVLAALRELGIPVVVTLHNYRLVCANGLLYRDGHPCTDCVGRMPWPGVVHRCYRDSAVASSAVAAHIVIHRARRTWTRDVNLIVTLTSHARARLLLGGLDPAATLVKHNFVADPGPRLQPASDATSVVYVGRLTPEKGILELVDAWKRLDRDDLDLVVIGDGPMREEVTRRAGARVEILGHLPPDQVRRRLLAARAAVVPSLSEETFGLTAVEGMAAGLPVIATDAGGLAELLPTHYPPLLSASSPYTWSSTLARFDVDFDLDRWSQAVRNRYVEAFSEERGLAALEHLYAQAIGAPR